MSRLTRAFVRMAVGSLLIFIACSSSDPGGGGGGGNHSLSNPDVLESVMKAEGLRATLGLIDALERIVVGLEGGALDGVTLTAINGGHEVVADVDFSGNASRESSLSATVTGDLALGAVFAINEISDPRVPSLTTQLTATVTETGPTSLSIEDLDGSMAVDEPGSMNATDADFTGSTLAVDRSTGTPDGSMSCDVSGEEETLNLTTTFESDGQGGWRVRVTGDGIDFTFP